MHPQAGWTTGRLDVCNCEVQGRCCRDQGDELQHLKLLHADLQREMEILKTRSESIQTLKTEVHHLGRQILQVRPCSHILT